MLIPTLAAGAFTYRKLGHIPNRVMVLSRFMAAGSVVGVFVGASPLPLVDKHTLKALLARSRERKLVGIASPRGKA